ncbi:MAG: hypothetical protein V4714_08600, partial [Bacteroidota bacterium]
MKRLLLLLLFCSSLFSCAKKLSPYSFTQHPAPVALTPRSVDPPASAPRVQSFPASMPPLLVESTLQRRYQAALEEIRQMLTGARPLDFKRAVFVTENAYLDNQLDYPAFCQAITQLAQASQGLQTKLDLVYEQSDRESVAKNAALFRLLTDTLAVDAQGQTVARQPFRYHLADFAGKQDWSNTFVTKLLATRLGNCHSLPFLYKILAEETGAQAYLSIAPNHIYLQHHNKQTGWYNTELTSGSFPVDAWLMASGYISTQTVVSRIYMDTLSLRQSVAFCLVDLAQGYQRKVADGQPDFVLQCTDLALQHYPNSIQALLVKAQALQAQYQSETHLSQKQALKATLTEVCRKIAATGYEEMPTSVYWEWLTSAGKEKYRHTAAPSQPSEHNPFTGEPILTLSQGKYPEIHQNKSRVQIGNVVYNVASGRIERFVQPDTTEWAISPEVAARFLSVDPLTRSYPMLTPYQFAGNMPIKFIDLDGLEPAEPGSEKGEYQVANRQGTNKEFGYTWTIDGKGKGSWSERSKISPAVNGTVTRATAQAANGAQGDLVSGDAPQQHPFQLSLYDSNRDLELDMLTGIVAGTTWQGDAAGRQLYNHFLNGGGTDLTLPNGSTLSSAIGSDERFL